MAEENQNNISEYDVVDKDTDTLVFDVKEGTMDIYDLLETYKSDTAVVKVNRLIEYGKVPIEVIAEKYSEVAGNITNKDLALMALDSVFFEVALQVTAEPNGIVIDLSTGFRDEELSREQEEALGLDSEASTPNVSREEKVLASIEKSLEKYKETRETQRAEIATKAINTKEDDIFYGMPSKAFADAIDDFRKNHKYSEKDKEKDEKIYSELNYDEAVGKGIINAKKVVVETDPSLIVLIDLIDKVNKVKGTPSFNVYLEKLNKFIGQDPKRKEIFAEITDENREILPQYKAQVKEYKDNIGIKAFFEKTQYLTEDDVEILSKDDKKELFMNFIASFKQMGPNNKMYGQIIENMQKIFPEITDTIKANKRIDTQKLFALTEKVLELDTHLDAKGFSKLMNACQQELIYRQYNEEQQSKKIDLKMKKNDDPDKIPDEEVDRIFAERAVEINIDLNKVLTEDSKKTDEEKYFEDSNIVKFSKIDAGNLKRKYKEFNSISWIPKKETAVRLSFLSLATLKENLESLSSDSPFYAQKLSEIQEKMEAMKQSNSDIDFDQFLDSEGRVSKDHKKEIAKYEKSKITEKILYDYITDEDLVTSRADYDKLSKEDKQEYLLNSIALLESTTNMKSTVSKFIARRLEIIETEENGLVSLVENEEGNKIPRINTEKLLEEYNKTSSHKFESFEELMQYTKVKELEYVSGKLEEYSNLREEDFFELHGRTHSERSDEIETIRMDFNFRQRDESSKSEETVEPIPEPRKENTSQSVEPPKKETTQEIEEKANEREENFSENNEQTALAVTDKKPSLFDRVKNIFSMLTNLTARAVDTFTNKSEEDKNSDLKETKNVIEVSEVFTQRIDGNVQNAIDEFNANKGKDESRQGEQQVSIEDDEPR